MILTNQTGYRKNPDNLYMHLMLFMNNKIVEVKWYPDVVDFEEAKQKARKICSKHRQGDIGGKYR